MSRRHHTSLSAETVESEPMVMPAVCVRRWCSVMGAYFDLTSNQGRYSLTGACRSTLPCSTSRRSATLVNDLLIDPIWNRVSSVTSRPEAMSATPISRRWTVRSLSVIARAMPGMLSAVIRLA